MIHLREQDNLYMDEPLAGFTKRLKDDGIVERQVDLLLIGAAYAIREGLAPVDSLKRHDLIRVANIDSDLILAFEASLLWYVREHGLPEPEDHRSLLDLLARIGSAGLLLLKKEWRDLSSGQWKLRLLTLCKKVRV